SFRAALATVLELELEEVPEPGGEGDFARGRLISRWLGGLGLGLVPVAEPRTFAWPGPWIARVQPPGGDRRFVVMYGVPSGVVWDPAGDGVVRGEWLAEGFVLAASDIALAPPDRLPPPAGVGVLGHTWVAASA